MHNKRSTPFLTLRALLKTALTLSVLVLVSLAGSAPVQAQTEDALSETNYDALELRNIGSVINGGPGAATGTVSETAPGYDWRAFREEGAVGSVLYSRAECSGNCQFGLGNGFWLIAGQKWEIDRSVSTVPLNEDAALRVEVHDGWNIVSNPLETEVPWSAVQEATGTDQLLWEWTDGQWREAEIFRSATDGVAYYFMYNDVSELTVPFPGTDGSSAQSGVGLADAEKAGRDKERSLTLSVMRDETLVSSVKAGIRSGGTEGLDRFDLHGPPGYFGGQSFSSLKRKRDVGTRW